MSNTAVRYLTMLMVPRHSRSITTTKVAANTVEIPGLVFQLLQMGYFLEKAGQRAWTVGDVRA